MTYDIYSLEIITTPTKSIYGRCKRCGKKSFRWVKERHVMMWYNKHKCA
jgi:hypothetical protein